MREDHAWTFSDLVPLRRDRPAYLGLAQAIRSAVMEGRIPSGSRLPSERALAEMAGLSRTTTTSAYRELVRTGWATSRQGSGTVIGLPLADRPPTRPLIPGRSKDAIDLATAAGLAPDGLDDLVDRALRWLPEAFSGTGYEPFGTTYLRQRIAAWYTSRNLVTTPEQITVTPGAFAALNVVLRVVPMLGRHMIADSPTYPNAISAAKALRARLATVALDEHGWNIRQWSAAIARVHPSAAYLIPDFHNPTGQLMDDDTRRQLAHLLKRANCLPIIDETTWPLNLDDVVMPEPFAAYLPDAFTLGSLSKAVWGGIRLGWIRSPPSLAAKVRDTQLTLNFGASMIDQLIATSFFDDPGTILKQTLRRMKQARAEWLTHLNDLLPDWRVQSPVGGLSLWVGLPEPLAAALCLMAASHGLDVLPGSTFSPDHTQANRLRIPLTLPPGTTADAATRLRDAWEDTIGREHDPKPFAA